jgi:subtilisin family serine protease
VIAKTMRRGSVAISMLMLVAATAATGAAAKTSAFDPGLPGALAEPPVGVEGSNPLALGSFSHAAEGFGNDAGARIPGRYIVVLEDSIAHPGNLAQGQTENHGGRLGFVYRHAIKGYSAVLSEQAVEALRRNPKVKHVTPDFEVEAFAQTVPTGIRRSFATENEVADIDGEDVRVNVDVAVIDTGVDNTHADLNVYKRTNCVPAKENPSEANETCTDNSGTDGSGHGTHVAGTVGAIDNGSGVVGVAPGARISAVRVLNNSGSGALSWIIAGVDWVTAHASEIEVANMSLGCGACPGAAMEEAIEGSIEAGVVYVVAAGNSAIDAQNTIPASFPDVITVSALADTDGEPGGKGSEHCFDDKPAVERTYTDDGLAFFSNWGSIVDIAAPGGCILSTLPGGQYGSLSGTSMASPHVAGAAALLASASNPGSKKDVEAIRNQLVNGASLNLIHTMPGTPSPLLYAASKPLGNTEAITGGSDTISAFSATLHGGVNPRGTKTEYKIEYGTDTKYGQSVPASPGQVEAGAGFTRISQKLNGLTPDTTYHYRLVATNAKGTVTGADNTFSTKNDDVLFTLQAPDTSDTTATLHGALYLPNLPEGTSTSYHFEYGLTPAYGKSAPGEVVENKTIFENVVYYGYERAIANLTNLEPGTTYHYRAVATTSVGTFYGPDQPFRTATWSREEQKNISNYVSCWSDNGCITLSYGPVYTGLWDGEDWTVTTRSEEEAQRVNDLDCVSATACMAVGETTNCEGLGCQQKPWKPMALKWSGSSWAPTSVPIPGGSHASRLRAVSCLSASSCIAVGYYSILNPNETLSFKFFAVQWDGKAWTTMSSSKVTSPVIVTTEDVSCTSASNCFAVWSGSVARWNGSEWSMVTMPEPAVHLDAVSCASASFCMVAGTDNDIERLQSRRWNGESWSVLPEVRIGRTAGETNIKQISCEAAWSCAAAGYIYMPDENWLPAIYPVMVRWDGEGWVNEDVSELGGGESGTLQSEFNSVSCGSPSHCKAGGFDRPVGAMVASYDYEVSPPTADTHGASDVHASSGALNGTVNGGALPASYSFEYDTKEYKAGEGAHGTSVPVSAKSIGSTTANVDVRESIVGLQPSTTYHYRLVASNAEGSVQGDDEEFTTPTAAYSFNENSGTVLGDSAGNHDGTIENGATWAEAGKYGAALNFDGTDDLVKIADANDLDLTSSFTLEAWVRPDAFTVERPVMAKGESAGGASGYLLVTGTGSKPGGYVASAGSFKSAVGPNALTAATWTHLAFTSDGANLRLYVDGKLEKTATAIAAKATAASLEIGHSFLGGYYDGLIDEVRLYDVPLDESQIQADRLTPVGPLAAYSFNENSGTVLGDSAGNHDGTIENGAAWTAGKYGSALNFDGTDDLVKIADANGLDLSSSFTLEAWVRPDTLTGGGVLTKGESSGGKLYGYWMNAAYTNGKPTGIAGNSSGTLKTVSGPVPMSAGAWSHLAFSSDGTTLSLYINGQLVATEAAVAVSATSSPLKIGTSLWGNFDGLIDDVRVYDSTLSEARIQADRDTGL